MSHHECQENKTDYSSYVWHETVDGWKIGINPTGSHASDGVFRAVLLRKNEAGYWQEDETAIILTMSDIRAFRDMLNSFLSSVTP